MRPRYGLRLTSLTFASAFFVREFICIGMDAIGWWLSSKFLGISVVFHTREGDR